MVIKASQIIKLPQYWTTKIFYSNFHTFEVEMNAQNINPLELAYVDPAEVNQFTGRIGRDGVGQVVEDIGRVMDGRWDDNSGVNIAPHLPKELTDFIFSPHIEDTGLHKSLYNHFVLDTKWCETEYYDILCSIVGSGHEWHGCTSKGDIHQRLNELDSIYHSIKTEGYRTQRDLRNFSDILTVLANEIVVDRSREGDFLLVCGRHRLSMAKLLELDEVPVTSCVYHRQFVESIS